MNSSQLPLITFRTEMGKVNLEVRLDQDTVWLNLNQLADLFERDKSVISRHLKNIFREEELSEVSTVAKFATVQQEGGHEVRRDIEHYNLDVIISVGYRVNSKRGVQFRQWATGVLKDHLIQGYTVNQKRLYEKGWDDLQRVLRLLSQTLENQSLVHEVGQQAIEIIHKYAKTWHLLLAYDEDRLTAPTTLSESAYLLQYEQVLTAISELKQALIDKGEASPLFGQQKEEQLQAIFGTIHQTFAGDLLYPSLQERAAHLLYFVIKDHPFIDGNKRIGSFLFLLYLQTQKASLSALIDDVTLVALSLLIAESDPKDKELMVKLIMNLITRG